MGLNLRDAAKKVTTLSELMSNREKIETQDLVKLYPDGVHVVACDLVETSDARYAVVVFQEDGSKYYNGGLILTKIVDAWLALGDMEAINKQLEKEPVKMKFSEGKTKSGGKSVTIIDIL